ncbi:MAG: N-acetylmuramoyl-L-alanine amidase [Dehalococcoidia bacterium]|nr:N-acetylmuramoyl-L-alanine amidase [Dehalococcoidia bacterium]
MPGVERVPTAAQGYDDLPPGSMRALAVMSHIMHGYQGTILRWARERGPSITPAGARFMIGRSGRLVQHVGVYDAAWHAGHVAAPTWALYRPGTNPNRCTVGIEHEGFSVPPPYPYDYLYDQQRPWPQPMVEASIAVHRWLMGELALEPAPDTVIGHCMTDSVTRADDPGAAWPRERVIQSLGGTPARPEPLTLGHARWAELGLALGGYMGRGTRPLRFDGPFELHELRICSES